jgi:glucose-1-phosphate adenylyltransferase
VLGARLDDALLGAATVVHNNADITSSIIRREAVIEEDAVLEDCIVMDYVRVGRGARLRKVIIDRHNLIEPGTVIGYDRDADSRLYTVSPGGVTVVPAGKPGTFARDSGYGGGYSE